jgi:CHAT domain-containing protein
MRALLLVAVMAGAAFGAAPPARFTPEQWRTLLWRSRLWKAAEKSFKEGRHQEDIALIRMILEINLQVLGPWHRHTERTLSSLGNAHQDIGEWASEATCRRAVVEARRRLDGEGHWRTVDARLDVAEALMNARHTPAQRDAARRARELAREATALFYKGESAKALPLSEEVVALRKEVLGEKHHGYAAALMNLGIVRQDTGGDKEAAALMARAAAINREVLGEGHPTYAYCLHRLAALRRARGEHAAALPLFRKSLAIRREALGPGHPSCAQSLNSLAVLHKVMGDYEAAGRLYRQALAIYRRTRGEDSLDYADVLSNLSVLLLDMGRPEDAIPLQKKALAVRKKRLARGHPEYALSLSNMAVMLGAAGDLEGEAAMHAEALAVRKKVLGERHPDYASSLAHLGVLKAATGDAEGGLAMYSKAVAIKKAALGERHPDYALALKELARLYRDRGDDAAALRLLEKALAIAVAQLRDDASAQSDRQQLAAAAEARSYLDRRLLVPDLKGHPSAAAHVLAWKGSVLLRQQHRRLFLRLAKDALARREAERLQAVTARLAALRSSPAATRARLEALEREQEEAQAELSRLSAAYREAREAERPLPEALAKALPEGAVLVDYLFHGRASGRSLTAFVHRRGKGPVRVELGGAGRVEEAVRGWRARLLAGNDGGRVGETLRGLIWKPLEKHIEGARVVLLSPDGALGTVPFAALPGSKEGAYLIEDVAIAVVTVPGAVPEMLRPVEKKTRIGPSLLVVGGLRYDPEEGEAGPRGEDTRSAPRSGREQFDALPATRAEAAAVRSSFEGLFKGGRAVSLSEGEATKAAVRKALGSVRYAHLATHGWFAPEEVKNALADEVGRAGERREPTGWHPLLLSGLALSDANRSPREGEVDGVLTALEVSEMDLTRLELAVLSACETGLGKVAGGEGILGMQRAFQAAGARSVIASLWKVDDRATRDLMADFYAAAWDTKKIVSRAEALRQAQLKMLREGRKRGVGLKAEKVDAKVGRLPPYYWAAFVLSGDWR